MIDESLDQVLEQAFASMMQSVWTALPARVIAAAGSTATVQPVPAVYLDGDAVPLPVLQGVPVCYPAGMTSPLQPGSAVLVLFSTLPLGRYRDTGAEGDPAAVRRQSLSDAWILPLLSAAATPGATVITPPPGGQVRVGSAAADDRAAREGDSVDSGSLALAAAGVAGGVAITLTWTPPGGGVPTVQTVTLIGAITGSGVGAPAALAGTIDSGSDTVRIA